MLTDWSASSDGRVGVTAPERGSSIAPLGDGLDSYFLHIERLN